ncbi:MAG: class I SAM-dependent methyltransferase [Victivallaceae bacterium]|nr:class I SAM-dependent methyltransferase [Victivallaceae bacterium]
MYHWNNVEIDGGRTTLGKFYQAIAAGSSVFDIGCACGDFGKTLYEQKQCRMTGVEFDRQQADIARGTGAYGQVIDFDLNRLSAHEWPELEGRFDYIVCADVLEHLISPADTLAAFKTYLKPDGKFLISLPNIAHASIKADLLNDVFNYTPHGILDNTHLRFFTWKSIGSMLALAGIKIIKADATFVDINAFSSPPPKFDAMPPQVLFVIFRDLHSYICQYTMEAVPDGGEANALAQQNVDRLNFRFEQFPPEVKKYALDLLAACGFHQAPASPQQK